MNVEVIRVSKIEPALHAAIMEIWNATGISNPARADDLGSIQANLEHGGVMLLAYCAGKLAGTAWLSHDFRRLYIHHMAVAPELQNRGIGRRLLVEALALAQEKGWQAKLEVHRDNAAARHLYASCGFTDLEGYLTMIKRN